MSPQQIVDWKKQPALLNDLKDQEFASRLRSVLVESPLQGIVH